MNSDNPDDYFLFGGQLISKKPYYEYGIESLNELRIMREEQKEIDKKKIKKILNNKRFNKMDYNEDIETINSEIFELLIQDFIEKTCYLMGLNISDFCDFFHSLQPISQLKFMTLIRKKNAKDYQ